MTFFEYIYFMFRYITESFNSQINYMETLQILSQSYSFLVFLGVSGKFFVNFKCSQSFGQEKQNV